jgi:hypothetical protein
MFAMSSSSWSEFLEYPEIFGMMIPIVAIVAGVAIVISRLLMRHRERMAMIERGMHPDHPEEAHLVEQDESTSVP